MPSRVMLRRALMYVKALRRREAEYAEECESYYRQGHRAHYCIHGTNQWTDYDNICGPCEDGYSMYELALMSAKSDLSEMERRTAWIAGMPVSVPYELRRALISWATEPITSDI